MTEKDITAKRISLKLPAYIQDYYKEQANRYGIAYGNFITMTLIKLYEQEENTKIEQSAIREMNDSLNRIAEISSSMEPQKILKDTNEVLQLVKDLSR